METTGKIEKIEEKKTTTGKQMYILHLSDGQRYSNFGQCPDIVKEAAEKKWDVRISYEQKGDYRNIKNLTRDYGKPQDQKAETQETLKNTFVPANEMNRVKRVFDLGGTYLSNSIGVTCNVLNKPYDKVTEDEKKFISTLFIWATRTLGGYIPPGKE